MKTIHSSTSLALFALSILAGCGSEAAVVGGRCRDGMELHGDICVTPTVALVDPNAPPPPQGSFGSSPASTTMPTPARPAPPSFVHDPYSDPYQHDPDAVPTPNVEPPIDMPPPVDVPPPPPFVPVCATSGAQTTQRQAMPLVACHGVCIPVDSDGQNCGACGKICPSNICVNGECQGATPGDVVLIGHDYTNALSGSAQTKVLVNALTIPTTDPIRVLSYENGASANAVSRAKALAAAGIRGRSVQFVVAESANDLGSSTLARSYDIVLIHDASAGDPVVTGASWADSLNTFTVKGGVVIALDNGLSPMPELLSSSGMLAVTSHTLMADGTHLAVTDAADVVGAQVLSPYAAFGSPITFQGVADPNVEFDWVVRALDSGGSLGDPVVLHRIVRDLK